MPSTISTPLSARVPNEQAAAFRRQAARFGLTPSMALATLVAGALIIEQQRPGDVADVREVRSS